jgi:hypothetical protein
VQSTPLVSSSGALVGIVSTLFPTPHRPTDIQIRAAREAAQLAANAIILFRARARTIELDPTNQPGRGFNHIHYEMVVDGKLHTAAAFRAGSEMRTLVARAVDAVAQSRQLLDEVDSAVANIGRGFGSRSKSRCRQTCFTVIALGECPTCPPRAYCSVLLIESLLELR